jgi:hypothetical protein
VAEEKERKCKGQTYVVAVFVTDEYVVLQEDAVVGETSGQPEKDAAGNAAGAGQ